MKNKLFCFVTMFAILSGMAMNQAHAATTVCKVSDGQETPFLYVGSYWFDTKTKEAFFTSPATGEVHHTGKVSFYNGGDLVVNMDFVSPKDKKQHFGLLTWKQKEHGETLGVLSAFDQEGHELLILEQPLKYSCVDL